MSLTIIKVQDVNLAGNSHNFFHVRTNNFPPGALEPLDDTQFSAELTALAAHTDDLQTGSNVIRNAGAAINSALEQHSNYSVAIDHTLVAQAVDEQRQVQIEISSTAGGAHNLPWELLVRQNAFIETDKRVPIIRKVAEQKSNVGNFPNNVIAVDPGLKVLSILAAEGIDAANEFSALHNAVNNSTLPMSVLILVADHGAVKDKIDAAEWREGAQVTCKTVPRFNAELEDQILDFGPQICHLFCHGVSEPVPSLIIQFFDGNLVLSAADIAKCLLPTSWLVSLNACSGSQASIGVDSDTVSLAYDLAYEGIPFVVGMRKQLPTLSSSRFTRGFLPGVFSKIEIAMATGKTTEIDFSHCINRARGLIIGNGTNSISELATRSQAWSIPTMTRRAEPFNLPGAFSKLTAAEIEKMKAALNEKLGQIGTLEELIEEFPEEQKPFIQDKILTLHGEVQELQTKLLEEPKLALR